MSSATSTSTPASKRGLAATTPNNAPTAPSRSPTRQQTSAAPSTSASTTPVRTASTRAKTGPPPSAKAAAKRNSLVRDPSSQSEEDAQARAEATALIEDLRDQLRKTETASEEYQKQLQVAQSRFDEALAEQTRLEETVNQHSETVLSLESQLRDLFRQKSDFQAQRDASESTLTLEREAASSREAELNTVIQRLKETLTQRDVARISDADSASVSRSASARGRASPNPDGTNLSAPELTRRDSSQRNTQLLLQKDRIIEELRLELAEAHVKVMEVDRAGGGRLQDLEKQLLEVRMTNAKLMEDNESYQFLLQERTLNGDFAARFKTSASSDQPTPAASTDEGSSTLADELESATADAELEDMKERRRVEKEMTTLRDQNKAMTLYIDKIITKLLASDHYEAIFDGSAPKEKPKLDAFAQQQQPQPSLQQQPPVDSSEAGKENTAAPSLLQRAGSLFGNRARPTRPGTRATSGQSPDPPPSDYSKPLPTLPTLPTEDPNTAPSVPLRGGPWHRRTGSDRSTSNAHPSSNYTTRVPSGQSSTTGNRPSTPTSRHASLSTSSPPRDAPIPEDDTLDDTPATATDTSSSATEPLPIATRTGSFADSLDVGSSTGPSSPPRSTGASSTDGGRSSGGAAVFSGSSKQMRPLRLVQEKAEADAERKKVNRGSWAGWFNNKAAQMNPLGPAAGSGAGSGSSPPPAPLRPRSSGGGAG